MPTRLTLGLSKPFSETCSRNSTILTQPHTTFMLKSSPPRWHGTKGWEPLGGHTGGAHRNRTSVLTAEAHGTQVSIVDDRAGPPQKYLDFDLPAYTVVRIKYLLLSHWSVSHLQRELKVTVPLQTANLVLWVCLFNVLSDPLLSSFPEALPQHLRSNGTS